MVAVAPAAATADRPDQRGAVDQASPTGNLIASNPPASFGPEPNPPAPRPFFYYRKNCGSGSAATSNAPWEPPVHVVVLWSITDDALPFFFQLKHGFATAGAMTMAEPTDLKLGVDDAQPNIERAKMILTELADAAQSAALSIVDEQKARAAARVESVAEAVRAAARSLERSQNRDAAACIDFVAHQIDAVADTIRSRHWAELIADIEDVARRQPTVFVAGAVAVGLIAGRFWTALRRRELSASTATVAKATENTIAAAVSSASGNGQVINWPPPSEARELP